MAAIFSSVRSSQQMPAACRGDDIRLRGGYGGELGQGSRADLDILSVCLAQPS